MKEKHKQSFLLITILVTAAIFGYTMIIYSVDVSKAVFNSINCCLTVIIPSLYGFLVLASFLVKTNFYAVMGKPFDLISRYVFKIPTELFSIFIISLFAGYPVGAKLINELTENNKISNKEAETMLCYCYASSPTFIIGLVGVQIFSSVKVGLYMYLSVVLTNILISILIGLTKKTPPQKSNTYTVKMSSQIFISSIESGAKSLFQVCIMIVFFSIFIAIINKMGIILFLTKNLSLLTAIDNSTSLVLVKSMLEISNLSSLPKYCFKYIPFITGIFSFGGICIVLQISALTKGKISLLKFILTRPIAAILSGIISSIIISRTISELAVSVSKSPTVAIRHISPIPSLFLLIMTILLLSKKNVAKL